MSPYTKVRQWKEGGKWWWWGGGDPEDVLPNKTMLTVNANSLKDANKSQSASKWNPGACTYQKHY